jgi:hypothetical protein
MNILLRKAFFGSRVAAQLQKRVHSVRDVLRLALSWITGAARRRMALTWRSYYFARYYASRRITRHRAALAVFLVLVVTSLAGASVPKLQNAFGAFFLADDRFSLLRNLLITLGGALVGSTAIGFSIVIFAVQMNFARTPYGLFRKLSSDLKLLGAFCATFLLALGVASLCLIPDQSWVAAAIAATILATTLILILFLYAYRRALLLINPTQQLNFLVAHARRDMEAWVRRARRAAPLLEFEEPEKGTNNEKQYSPEISHDMVHAVYFQANPHWTAVSQQAIKHCIQFARRYAEERDHEVSSAALNAVVLLNVAYVAAKGKTFFAQHLIFDNPLATDALINETLEQLRQNAKIGLTRGDEEQIEQTFRALASLVQAYVVIDYSNKYAQEKQHAQLAASYLSQAVESALPRDLPDVVMEGVRLMGQSAQLFLSAATPNEIVTLAEKIASISCSGAIKETFRPVTLVGVEALARLTFNLVRTKNHDIHFAVGELRRDVSLVAKLLLTAPDGPLFGVHSTYLAPYYSLTNTQALAHWLAELASALFKADANDNNAVAVIHNVAQWADGLYQTEKELLLAAIEKQSHFTFDVVHWIAHITKLLIFISQAPACAQHTKRKLIRHANWLISVFSWIPHDEKTVRFIEAFRITETLFEVALDARLRGCSEVFESARETLTSRAFKAGRHRVGWAILERSIYGLAALALCREGAHEALHLKAAISKALGDAEAPDQELRDHAAREIRCRAHTLYRHGHFGSHIDNAMAQVNEDSLRALLIEVADLLSPATANEPVRVDYP